MAKKKPKKVEIAYTINDAYFGDLKVKKTANAWWKAEEKVVKLFQGLKMDCKPRELRLLAGITNEQYDYFLEVHPEFYVIFKDFRAVPSLKARATLVKGVQTDPNLAFKYLERKEPDEFREQKQVDVKEIPSLVFDVFDDDEKSDGKTK